MRALVTGVSRGIGRSICLKLAADALARGEEAVIVACATGKSPDLEQVVGELQAMGARSIAVKGDLTTAEDPVRVMEETLDFCGGLDALVNNAGFPIIGTLKDIRVSHWDKMFGINVRSTLLLARTAHAALAASRGSIVAIGSTAAEVVSPNLTGYSASKAALVMLINQMAYEWGPDGIRANVVSPGQTRSRSTEGAWAGGGDALRARAIPLRRVGEPEDIANAVAFLTGPESTFITGQNLMVEGGVRHITMDAAIPKDTNYFKT